jgi:hypothetical protein
MEMFVMPIPIDMKVVADDLMQREDLMALLKEASAQMALLRKKQKEVDAGGSDVFGPTLPKALEPIIPLINAYVDDREGWVTFLRYLRDDGPWDGKSIKWRKLHVLMRAEASNASAYRRRFYAGQAADLFEIAEGELKKGQRTRYMDAVKKLWTAQHEQKQSNAWALSGKAHLPVDERLNVTLAFWNKIEEELNAGHYPTVELD